jgi:hypothetical protein
MLFQQTLLAAYPTAAIAKVKPQSPGLIPKRLSPVVMRQSAM